MQYKLLHFLLITAIAGDKNVADINKLKENWSKFVQNTLAPNTTCYKTAADYGILKVKTDDPKCDLTAKNAERKLCIKLKAGAGACKARAVGGEVTITLTDVTQFCADATTALHMLLHSTSTRLGHGATLPQAARAPRHTFLDPLLRVPSDDASSADWRSESGADRATPSADDDWPNLAVGGRLLVDTLFHPSRLGYRLLVTAADPRYQADLQVQWMGEPDLSHVTLTKADSLLLDQTACRKHRTDCKVRCRGHLDSACHCVQDSQPTLPCMRATPTSDACDPASGDRDLCPYRVTMGADLHGQLGPDCAHVTAVVNELQGAHPAVRRYLEAPRYPWRYLMVTVLACTGRSGRLTDVVVGFPDEYRRELRDGRLPHDREVLCQILRVYITNAESQVLGADSHLTYESFCLDDLVLAPLAHLSRPRRQPGASGRPRDAVHLWLGPTPKGVSVSLGKLVVKLYAVRASSEVVMPYKALTQLTAEPLTLGKCVVEVSGKNVSEKNDSDVTTTKAPFNFSQGAAMLSTNRLRVASTGSVLGLLLLLALFVYCMCLRTAPQRLGIG
ncbi:uncharacterized protein LOC119095073 [Pollicipes pollicipes]|uniref:uncharacterized protein LOC119095073 n=1 Tax=Pollicipes pollicipes TaxID=41117 RepID=UPI001884A364|nr:uncharacterized protein LOC119095073 [Pollicipes pollicipes]